MFRVLIVEDDPMVAMINKQYICRNKNFQVIGTCKDGKHALDFVKNNAVELVILDVYMPHTNGFELLRQIRKQKMMVDIIMVTAANDGESLEEALRLGVVDYLVKPFTFDRFQMALEKFIAQTYALKGIGTLNQTSIDYIMEKSRMKNEELYPKGIQEKTLHRLLEHLNENKNRWLTGDEIAEMSSLTSVTVRRYMNYLVESGKVVCEMNYETGGRPCMKYKTIFT